MSMSENIAALKKAVEARVPESARAHIQEFLTHTLDKESGGDITARPKDKNGKPIGTASGLYQFTDETKRAYNYGTTVESQTTAAVRLTLDNRTELKNKLHREPSAGELYLAHFLGSSTAAKVLNADPSTPVTALLQEKVFTHNPKVHNSAGKNIRNFTAGDIANWAAEKMGARVAYDNKKDHTPEEEEAEKKSRRDIVDELGLSKMFDGMGFMGQIFMALIKMFLQNAVPSAEMGIGIEQPKQTAPQVASTPLPVAPKEAPAKGR